MGKKHFGHWSGKGHGHHKHGLVVGTRGDDDLEGSARNDFIIGLKGDDELFGNGGHDRLLGGKGDDALFGGDGNDKLHGGKGDDLLVGGAGNDKLFGDKGDDIAVYSMSANLGNDACGRGDFYDGGKGKDTLRLELTEDQFELESVQDDIERFEQFLMSKACGRGGVFEFESFDLKVRNFEKLDIVIVTNADPVAVADAYDLDEDSMLVVPVNGVLANDSDPDAQPQPLSAALVSGPSHGVLVFNADGSFSYRPDDDYFGPDAFTYQASDGQDLSAETTVSLTVHEVNDAPVANPDSATVEEDSENNTIDVLGNDSPGPNESGQMLKVVSAHATHGSVQILGNGTLHYTPDADYFGDDLIEYVIEDNGTTAGAADPLQATSQVAVQVTEVNDAPTVIDDFLQVTRNADGSPIAIKLSDLLVNDIPGPENESGQTLIVLTEPGRLPPATQRGGTLEYDDSTQTIWYTPPDEFPTPDNLDRFGYWIEDDGTTNGVQDPLTNRGFVNLEVNDAIEVAATSDADLVV